MPTPGTIAACWLQVKVYRCLMDIAAGMQYLHSANILHGDLKLGNILLKSTTTDVRGALLHPCILAGCQRGKKESL